MKKIITASIDEKLSEAITEYLKDNPGMTRSCLISEAVANVIGYDLERVTKVAADREKHKHRCKQCGFKWESFKQSPAVCPDCKSYFWDTKGGQRVMFLELQLKLGRFGSLISDIAARLQLPEKDLTAVLTRERPVKQELLDYIDGFKK